MIFVRARKLSGMKGVGPKVRWFHLVSFGLGVGTALLSVALIQRLVNPRYDLLSGVVKNIPNIFTILGFFLSLYVALTIGETKRRIRFQNTISQRLDALARSSSKLIDAMNSAPLDVEDVKRALSALDGNLAKALNVCNEENKIEAQAIRDRISTVSGTGVQSGDLKAIRDSLDDFRQALSIQVVQDSVDL